MVRFDIQAKQTAIFQKYGAFFAFSPDQFNRQKQDCVKYTALGGGSGLIVPTDNAQRLMDDLDTLHNEKIAYEVANNSAKSLIWDHFADYEVQISGDLSTTIEVLADYGITEDQIRAEYPDYYSHCIKHGYF